jgi:hypothetical protein
MPADFPETFARVGWDAIESECRAHKTTIKRWMIEYGEVELQQMRRDFLIAKKAALGHRIGGVAPGKRIGQKYWSDGDRKRGKRYVMGRTLTAVIGKMVEGEDA